MKRTLLLLVLLAAVIAFFAFGLDRHVSLEQFQASRARIEAFRDTHAITAMAAFFALYVAVTALSLPVSTVLTLAGGAVFGLLPTVVMVSFAASIGATLAFLSARTVLGDWVQARYADRLATVNAGIAREGALYLFALRLVPVFPFFVVNLVMGLTRMRARTYYAVTQLGMLPANFAYAYAGTQLGQFRLSPGLLAAFAIVGLLPLVAKRALAALRARR